MSFWLRHKQTRARGCAGVLQVEVLPIPKADALAWLDGNGSKAAGEPPRYARATVMRGGLEHPDVQEYRVCHRRFLADLTHACRRCLQAGCSCPQGPSLYCPSDSCVAAEASSRTSGVS